MRRIIKRGGTRLKKLLQAFGFAEPATFSRNKARAARVIKESGAVNEDVLREAMKSGEMQSVLDGQFISQPGVFGWNKVDNGSRILIEHLPTDIKGKFADFGCG